MLAELQLSGEFGSTTIRLERAGVGTARLGDMLLCGFWFFRDNSVYAGACFLVFAGWNAPFFVKIIVVIFALPLYGWSVPC